MDEEKQESGVKQLEPIFRNISADGEVLELESLCMECHENGITRIMMTKVPHFRDLLISAFECSHCGNRNNEVKSATPISDRGLRQTCLISSSADLNRQVVISEFASILLEELSLEIPSAHKAYLSTIEGIISKVADDLREGQEDRRTSDVESFEKLAVVIARLDSVLLCQAKINFVVDDPSGNSYIESLCAPNADPKLKILYYQQSRDQLLAMGIDPDALAASQPGCVEGEGLNASPDAVYCFQTNCPSCSSPCETRMHMVEIPHFREVIIMATVCDYCGYRSNEVKSGGAIAELGKKITLTVSSEEDLNRDVLKSETCELTIPEIDLHVTTSALGGRFTTLEGLLNQVADEIRDKMPFIMGDSATIEKRQAVDRLLADIEKVIKLELVPCHVILDDPLAQSYVQNLYAPDPDPSLSIESYERSFEQNEQYGLNDIKVDGDLNAEN